MAKTTIHSDYIPDNAITGVKIAENSITAREIATNAITSLYVADDSVTADKLANSINTDIATGVAALPKAGGTMTGDLKVGATIASTGGTTNNRGMLLAHQNNTNQSYVGRSENGVADTGNRITFDYDNDKMQLDSDGDIILTPTSNVGIGETAPDNILHVKTTASGGPQIHLDTGTGSAFMNFDGTNLQLSTQRDMVDGTWHDTSRSWGGININGTTSGSTITFTTAGNNNTSPTTRMTIDTSGRVGIGTTSPGTYQLAVNSGTAGVSDALAGVYINGQRSGVVYNLVSNNTGNAANRGSGIQFRHAGFLSGAILHRTDGTAASGDAPGYMTFHTSTDNSEDIAERLRIDSSGKVGIGTNSPEFKLHVVEQNSYGGIKVSGANAPGITIEDDSDNAYSRIVAQNNGELRISADVANIGSGSFIAFRTAGDVERMRIDSSGTMILLADGAANLGRIQFSNQASTYQILGGNYIGYMGYKTGGYHRWFGSDTAEKMRLDSSGNLLVGGTSAEAANSTTLYNSGQIVARSSSSTILELRTDNAGDKIISFRNNAGQIGSVNIQSSTLQIGTGNTQLAFSDADDAFFVRNEAGANRDGSHDLGKSSVRFKDLYLSGGAYIGGTGSANKLDDYEEGTFTATLANTGTSPAPTANGSYTKIGRQVTIHIYFASSAGISSAGNCRISGLPFSASVINSSYGMVFYTHGNVVGGNKGSGYVTGTSIDIIATGSTGYAQWNTGTRYGMWTGIYQTA